MMGIIMVEVTEAATEEDTTTRDTDKATIRATVVAAAADTVSALSTL